jgi:putative ABC transport system substrate-binding protein
MLDPVKRRTFLAAALLPAAARAQPQPPLVGIMRVNGPAAELFLPTFRRDMARLGYEEGKNYRTQVLFADGDTSRLPAMAVELVKAGAQVLVPFGNPGVAAAQKAAGNLPIVALADDLAGSGLVASMARPGGNTSGVSIMSFELDPKRLEVLHEIVPAARRIGVLVDPTVPSGKRNGVEAAADKLGLLLAVVRAQAPDQLAPAIAELQAAKVEAVQFLASPFLNAQRAFFIERLRELRVPGMYEWPETVEEGGLASYAPHITLCYRYVAVQIAKVLKGAKPADLPVEQPSTFVLALNTGPARAIGLTIPEAMLLRADVVVD